MGLILSEQANVEINISGKTDGYIIYVTVTILDHKKLIAEKEFRIRNKFWGDITDVKRNGNYKTQLIFLTQDTFWNNVLELTGVVKPQYKLIEHFIKEQINVIIFKQKQTVFKAKLIKQPNILHLSAITKGEYGNSWCNDAEFNYRDDLLETSNVLYKKISSKNTGFIPIERVSRSEKLLCSRNYIYQFSFYYPPTNFNQEPKEQGYYQIMIYDKKGKNLANFKYIIPTRCWFGKNILRYFNVRKQDIIIGIEEKIENEGVQKLPATTLRNRYLFYKLPTTN
ncbi:MULTISPECIES: hypothetical protein [Pasteurellaceae]|uniref:Uncharacterized protein n=1 Tax=Pasteurella atlantica TaxID=2827233 RepID=A0AAW8CMI1_9PAST|nr:hypothetical protein [Pasteurella atlantica]MBR0572668.1 hypothetical protein [Pasteurella atlantica]MDP8038613.1 hypothetical protein [Pasteurella atlantica]MDP8040705.1 hypothetical protein [Pasteurella atlantica]MDP8042840.1 hypothetical protein [Pasteurella atlantica]MDP8044927.1 hypothetical protein [Pasteurella atlantica]